MLNVNDLRDDINYEKFLTTQGDIYDVFMEFARGQCAKSVFKTETKSRKYIWEDYCSECMNCDKCRKYVQDFIRDNYKCKTNNISFWR